MNLVWVLECARFSKCQVNVFVSVYQIDIDLSGDGNGTESMNMSYQKHIVLFKLLPIRFTFGSCCLCRKQISIRWSGSVYKLNICSIHSWNDTKFQFCGYLFIRELLWRVCCCAIRICKNETQQSFGYYSYFNECYISSLEFSKWHKTIHKLFNFSTCSFESTIGVFVLSACEPSLISFSLNYRLGLFVVLVYFLRRRNSQVYYS